MNTLKKSQISTLADRSTLIVNHAKRLLAGGSAQHLSVAGKKAKTMPILKLNFADHSAGATLVNHASHSSHSSHTSHASHHSRHR